MGTTDCAAALPSNYQQPTTCPPITLPSHATAHKTCFHTAVYSHLLHQFTVFNPSFISLFESIQEEGKLLGLGRSLVTSFFRWTVDATCVLKWLAYKVTVGVRSERSYSFPHSSVCKSNEWYAEPVALRKKIITLLPWKMPTPDRQKNTPEVVPISCARHHG